MPNRRRIQGGRKGWRENTKGIMRGAVEDFGGIKIGTEKTLGDTREFIFKYLKCCHVKKEN